MIEQVRPGQWQDWLARQAEPQQVLMLDVREPWEVALASVQPQGFAWQAIPLGSLPEQLHTLSPDQTIACLCHHGMRSQRAAQYLAQAGFAHVVNIAGGIAAWSHEADPTVPVY
jgi:rhodanese-related sulfurtransferase